jgi:hypothetical protein
MIEKEDELDNKFIVTVITKEKIEKVKNKESIGLVNFQGYIFDPKVFLIGEHFIRYIFRLEDEYKNKENTEFTIITTQTR